MRHIYARPIRDIFRPRLPANLALVAELHFERDQHLPDAHLVREKKTGTYFMHRGGGVLLDLPQDQVVASLQDSGLLRGESPSQKVKRELASLMRSWRRKARINTREAGERLGISPRTVENIEQGRGFSNPNLLVLALLQAAKGVTKPSALYGCD
jgi:DNA-binding XRE family transcriptional regulator